jgi:branched-chain amino acid transport system ATP-binding protein
MTAPAGADAPPLIEVVGLTKRYGEITALDGLDAVVDGSIIGLLGPNGAGKSTLFSVISGFLQPMRGSVHFEGRPLTNMGPAERARAGMVRTFQIPREFRHLTVRENLCAAAPDQPGEHLINLALRPARVARREGEIRQQAEDVMAFLKLAPVADVPSGHLSGGQKKLLELGRVMMLRPKLILLDEPFAGVNAVLIGEIIQRIRELHRQGIGFFIIEHDLDSLGALVEQMHVLDQGTLLASGAPGDVLGNARVREAYLGGAVP